MTDDIKKNIVDRLNLAGLSQDKKDQLVLKMTAAVLKRIFLEAMEKLNEKDQEEYEKMIDENATPDKLEEFLKAKIQNYDKMIKGVVEKFEREMLAADSA